MFTRNPPGIVLGKLGVMKTSTFLWVSFLPMALPLPNVNEELALSLQVCQLRLLLSRRSSLVSNIFLLLNILGDPNSMGPQRADIVNAWGMIHTNAVVSSIAVHL